MMRSLLLIVILSLFYVRGTAACQQQEYRDSLFHELEMGKMDTSTFFELCDCIKVELFNDPMQSRKEAKRVLNIAYAADFYRAVPRMITLQGISYDLMGNYDSALVMYDSALIYARRFNLKEEIGNIYNNYSIVYSILGQLERSIDYSMMALEIFEDTQDSVNMAKIYNGLGSRYSEMGMNEQAIGYYEKAIAINEQFGELKSLVRNYGNIGTVYSELDLHEKALEYYTKAYMIQKDQDNSMDMSITLSNMAITYRNLEKYELALSFAEQSFIIANEINDRFGILTYLVTTAEINREQGNDAVAMERFLKAEGLADSLGAKQSLIEIYSGLSSIYAGKNEFEKAYQYTEKYNEERISLLDTEKNNALDRIKEFEDDKVKTEIDLLTKDAEIQDLMIRRQKIWRNSIAGLGGGILLITLLLWHRYRYVRRTRNTLAEKNIIIQDEKEKSETLLLNILPEETAEELKEKGSSKARRYEMVSVLFTDFKGFTGMAERLSPDELVAEIDHCFKAFDNIISRYDIEKIKTIGDAYMCAGGLPVANKTNPADVVNAALDIREFMLNLKKSREEKGQPFFEIRIGVHTGPVVAGIVGVKKFQYDIWGDTVNVASRMESSGEIGEVNISGTTYNLVKDQFKCVHRGKVEAKNKGAVDMYFVQSKK